MEVWRGKKGGHERHAGNESCEGYDQCPGRWRCPLPSLPWCTPLTICPLKTQNKSSWKKNHTSHILNCVVIDIHSSEGSIWIMWDAYSGSSCISVGLKRWSVACCFNHMHFQTRFLPCLALESDSAFQVFFLASAAYQFTQLLLSSLLSQHMCSVEKDVDSHSLFTHASACGQQPLNAAVSKPTWSLESPAVSTSGTLPKVMSPHNNVEILQLFSSENTDFPVHPITENSLTCFLLFNVISPPWFIN